MNQNKLKSLFWVLMIFMKTLNVSEAAIKDYKNLSLR